MRDQQNGQEVLFTALDILNYINETEVVNDEIVINKRIFRLSTFRDLSGGGNGNNGNNGGNGNGDGSSGGNLNLDFNGNRPISRQVSGLFGVNPGTTTIKDFLERTFYPSVPAVAQLAIAGGNYREYGGSTEVVLQWAAIKNTAAITAITVAGDNITASGATQQGNEQTAAIQNVTTSFTMQVVADTTVAASVTLTWLNKRYWGSYVELTAVPDNVILALNSELADNRIKNYNGINAGGNYLVFAWPSAFGQPTFTVNGLPNTAFTKVRANSPFTNANGYTTDYDVWMSNTQQNSPITLFDII